MDYIRAIERQQIREDIPQVRVADNVKVHYRIKEGDRERIQVFQGDVIRMAGAGARETFTVRKMSFGVGVERTFPLHSPKIAKLEVVRHGRVRRAKLYYLRDKVGKAARIPEALRRSQRLSTRLDTRVTFGWPFFYLICMQGGPGMANMTSSVSASQVAGELASATFEEIPALVEHYREDPRQQVIKACERALKRHDKELAERERVNDMYELMHELGGDGVVVGVDEVGRGSVAGPLTVCAVCLPMEPRVWGINDSKAHARAPRVALGEDCRGGDGNRFLPYRAEGYR